MNYALFLGFTSIPLSEITEFQTKINLLFEGHPLRENPSATIYKPQYYQLFGDYDLLTLAIVDDAEFALRSFTPFNPRFKSDDNSPFDHQVLLSLGIDRIMGIKNNDLEKAIEQVPLVSVIRIKLSTSLLAAFGFPLREALINLIEAKLSKEKLTKWILSETFSWNEFTLVVFSFDYDSVFRLLVELREIKRSDLRNALKGKRFDTLFTPLNHPVIKNTHTTFGFRKNHSNLSSITVNPFTSILTKGNSFGKLFNDLKANNKFNSSFNISLGVGNTDIVLFPKKINSLSLAKIKDLFEWLTVERKSDKVERISDIVNIRSTIVSEENVKSLKNSIYNQNLLKKLLVKQTEIDNVVNRLREEGFSKIERDGVLNILSEFNCAIQDTYLYGYFLDLRPFISDLISKLSNDNFYSEVGDRNLQLRQITETFSIAYNNRFLQSFIMNDITDNNIFFKGGVQNLISTFSVVQTVMNDITGLQNKFIYVHGNSDIVSSQIGIGLNYIHLIQPLLVIQHIVYENIMQAVGLQLDSVVSKRILDDYFKSATVCNLADSERVDETKYRVNKYYLKITETSLTPKKKKQIVDDVSKAFERAFHQFAEDKDALEHIITDYIVYFMLFNEDINLMEYIYWGVFASDPDTSDGLNDFQIDYFYWFYIRIWFLEEITGKRPDKIIAPSFMPRESWNVLLSVLGKCKEKELFTAFFNSSDFKSIKKLALKLNLKILWNNARERNSMKGKLILPPEEWDSTVKENIQQRADNSEESTLIYFSLIVSYYHDFIKTLYENWFTEGKLSVLLRVDKGASVLIPGQPYQDDNYNPYLFDQLGGYYIKDPAVRAEYLEMRRELLKKLSILSYERKYLETKNLFSSKDI